MRTLALALALAAVGLAAPAQAQVSFSPLVGYDLELEGPSIGLAFEVGAPLANLPLTPSIRPLVEYVFVGDDFGSDFTFVRANVDLLARFAAGGPAFQPYGKAGLSVEYASVDVGTVSSSDTDVALNIGGGVEFTRFLLEGELGLGGVDGLRIRAGYRF